MHRRIGLGETAFGISVLTLLIWALFWQRDHWQVTIDGELLPVLAPAAWSPWLVLLLVILLAMVVLEIVKYRIGRWTVRLATWNTVLNLGFASIVVVLWAQESLLSPGILEAVPGGLLNPVPWIVVAITVFDTAEGWWSLRRGAAPGNSRNHPARYTRCTPRFTLCVFGDPGPSKENHEARHPPRVRRDHRDVLVWQPVHDPQHCQERHHPRGRVQQVPPLLHR